MPPDLALQKAKLQFIATSSKEKTLPYYWAATVLAGKTKAIDFDKKNTWMPWALVGALLVVSAGFVWIRKRRRSTLVDGR